MNKNLKISDTLSVPVGTGGFLGPYVYGQLFNDWVLPYVPRNSK